MTSSSTRTCPQCGADVPSEFQYCGRCGAALTAKRESLGGERRQITVMFCDLVGSVALSRLLDPEDFARVVHRYQHACVKVIEAHGGYVAQYLGDGILAYFGYPTTDDRVAEEAVRAGLEVIGGIRRLSGELMEELGLSVSVRIGVHTGLVVVDDMGSGTHRERLALGETPNLAARLQSVAPTDTLLISHDTFRLVEGTFHSASLGDLPLKGIDRPQHVYRVLEERHDDGLVDHWTGVTGTAGREADLQTLLHEWKLAAAGQGRAVLLGAEPGLGKTHMVQHVRASIGSAAHYGIVCRCAPNMQHSAFHPIVDWLGRILNFYPEQSVQERLDMLRFVAERNGLADDDTVPLLAALMTKTSASSVSELGYSPARARARTEKVLEELVFSMSAERPLLLIMEDVQWIDPSTRSFLNGLALQMASRPVLLLMTTRPAAALGWPPSCPILTMELGRLTADQIDDVIAEAAAGRPLPSSVVDRIREKADGVPLYAQEFAKMVLESGSIAEDEGGFRLRDDVPELTIPSTLQDSLMARLDRLMPVKEVAQVCAVLGRTFTPELVEAVSDVASDGLRSALDQLVAADLLVVETEGPVERYMFRHALLQEAAYESMLRRRRARIHRRVAKYLIQRDGAQTETIAYHLTQAGDLLDAARFWCKAGSEAQQRWENEEAVGYYGRGIELLQRMPSSEEPLQLDFELHVGFAAASLQQKGYSHPDVAAAFERAADLAYDMREPSASIPATLGLLSHYTVVADHTRAEVLAERLAQLAQIDTPSLYTFSALQARAVTWFWQGEISPARKLIEKLMTRFRDMRSSAPSGIPMQHPLVGGLSYLSLILWCQGETERAVTAGDEAVRMAKEIQDPFNIAFSCGFNSVLHSYRGDTDAVHRAARSTVECADRYGFPFWLAVGNIMSAWAVSTSEPARSVDGMRAGLLALRAAGVRIWTTYPAARIAELLGRLGRQDEAIGEFDALLADCERHGEYYFMPEVRRMRARLFDATGDSDEAARDREYAFSLAQKQGASALTIRILNDILRYDSAPSPRLRDVLRTTLDAVTPDSESIDLIEARRLLTDASGLPSATNGRA